MDEIRGYRILSELPATSGTVYFAERRGKRYVLKEYMNYRFPTDEGEECPPMLRHVEERAQRFYDHLQHTTSLIREKCRNDGLLNVPLEFFRSGKQIFKVTRQIEDCGVPYPQLRGMMTPLQMSTLLKTALLQLKILEDVGFVHGDIKPDNLVISHNGKVYSASIIDYDTGFIQGDAMHVRADYTPEYAAPEMILLQYRLDADDEQEELKRAFEQVRCQADIYAMACVFVYLLTGESLMCLDAGGDPVPPGQQMLNGYPVQVPYVHPVWRPYLRRMLSADPLARCSPREVIDGVNACITTGLFHELTSPFAGLRNYRLKKDKPPMCRANMAVGQRGNELVLLWHEEDCWQLRRTFFRQRRSVKALQKRQREALGRLEALALRLQNALGQAEILRPFAVLRQEGRVFCLQKLPKGELLPLSALHSLIQPEQIDQLMYRLLMEMQRCHQEGLICGTMDSNSLWVAHCEGHVQMILTGTHRMLDLKSLPHGSMIDASPELLAPELARYMTAMGEENSKAFGEMIGSQTDVFSLGLLYHLMLTGRLPEITDESSTCYGMAAEGESLRLDGSLSPERARIISRMIVFEPADRLQSCAEAARLITTIGELSEAEPLQGQNDEAPEHWVNDLLNEEAESLTSQDDPPESDSAVDDTGWLKDLPLDFLDIGEAELWGDDPEAAVAEALHLSDDDDDVVYIPDDESDEDWFDEAGPEPEESPQALPDLETCFRATSLNVRRDGFLKEPARRWETGESVLLRKLLPREAQWMERQDWYEARRRAWNDAAEEAGLLSVKEIVRHDGVLYGAFDAPEETEQPTWIDVAGNGVEQVTKCAIELVTQLERLRACNLCCSLISPGELLFTGEAPNVQTHLLGFDHVRRLGDMDDAREWAALLRDRWQQSDCGSWEVNQSQCYLAPEAWENVFTGKHHELIAAGTDLFSVGVLLHVMISGHLPVTDANNWREAFLGNKVTLDPQLPFAYRWLIGKLLKEDPDQRPASCAEVLGLLNSILEQRKRRHSVTVRRGGELVLNEKLVLYAKASDGTEYCVDEAESNGSGRVTFAGYLPSELAYEVRGKDVRQACRWRLMESIHP